MTGSAEEHRQACVCWTFLFALFDCSIHLPSKQMLFTDSHYRTTATWPMLVGRYLRQLCPFGLLTLCSAWSSSCQLREPLLNMNKKKQTRKYFIPHAFSQISSTFSQLTKTNITFTLFYRDSQLMVDHAMRNASSVPPSNRPTVSGCHIAGFACRGAPLSQAVGNWCVEQLIMKLKFLLRWLFGNKIFPHHSRFYRRNTQTRIQCKWMNECARRQLEHVLVSKYEWLDYWTCSVTLSMKR